MTPTLKSVRFFYESDDRLSNDDAPLHLLLTKGVQLIWLIIVVVASAEPHVFLKGTSIAHVWFEGSQVGQKRQYRKLIDGESQVNSVIRYFLIVLYISCLF